MEREKISLGLQGIDDEFIVNAQISQKKRWLKTTMGKVALVACLPLLCAAGIATGVFVDVIDVFAPLFGGTNPQTEIIQEIGRPVGASVTSHGVTLTVDAVIGDENTAVIVYTFANQDGTALTLESLPEAESKVENGTSTHYYYGFQQYIHEKEQELVGHGVELSKSSSVSKDYRLNEQEDGSIQFTEIISSNDIPLGKKVTSYFHNLSYTKVTEHYKDGELVDTETEDVVLIEGTWEITFRLDYGKSTKTFNVRKSFQHQGREITVDTIEISPFSLYIEYEFPKFIIESALEGKEIEDYTEEDIEIDLKERQEFSELLSVFMDSIPFEIRKKDGSFLEVESIQDILYSSNQPNVKVRETLLFDEIVPLEDISSINFGEISVQVS